ncbi:hypothetical protein FGE12_12280 [Aggregicoccus sp. 17bor-14]|uniref:hypothetical protein n=1 Tax=Myxococcaceae TaxID=31 RepID=UPI00129CD647|nr:MULTISPECIES: hypothetical protein [Myxococcaceae]MBF5043167.1 hypothetical protein [Simulacricoccus sp. 17bor-14]MRI88926.1 hypothetical protein [Aggregicoccus sp. 17bor-14]
MATTARSTSQRTTSALNGTHSHGPNTPEGKASSSMNAVQHGLTARGALLPSETVQDYEANLGAWVATLQPGSPGEVQLVSTIADVQFRLARLERLEQQQLAAAMERRLGESAVGAELVRAREAHRLVRELIFVVGGVREDQPGERARALLPLLRVVLQRTEAVELPVAVEHVLGQAIAAFEEATGDELAPLAAWQALYERAHLTQAGLAERLGVLETALEAERVRVADETLLGDDKELARLARHRAQLHKQLEAQLGMLKTVRELALSAPGGGSGSFSGPVLVELRLVGRGPAHDVSVHHASTAPPSRAPRRAGEAAQRGA